MKRKNVINAIVILIGIFCLTGFLFAVETEEGERIKHHKTVVIHAYEGVTPDVLVIKPGTTVIWLNLASVSAEINFLDEEVVEAADCPVYFFIGRDGTYESHEMCSGYVASLCFLEKGRFDYVVEELRTSYGEEKVYRGTILVR